MKSISYIFGLFCTVSLAVALSLGCSEAKAASSTFQLQDNRIIIQVMINGQGPFFMMFDTGASNILSDDVASALQLKRYGHIPIEGGGENAVSASYCEVQNLEVSNQTMQNNRFICMDLHDMQNAIGFPRLDGLIGYEVFSQFLTEINFDKMQISLKSFSSRKNSNGQIVPLGFYGTMPTIDAVLDGIPGRFWLDTGDRASATLSLPFIQNFSLRQKYNPTFSTMTGYGIGGPLMTSMVFANEFEFGGLTFTNTLIRLPTSYSRGLNDPNSAGTIGTGLLRQFNIVFDYSRHEMILSKNAVFVQDRSFDRAGMWISEASNGFQVRDVVEGGPAWNAGVRTNQVILAINDVDAKTIDLLNLREQIKDRRAKKITVLVQDGSGTAKLTLILQDLITTP
jgi:hypothetical protein